MRKKLPDGMRRVATLAWISALYKRGKTFRAISEMFGYSHEHVRSLLQNECGLSSLQGGRSARSEHRRIAHENFKFERWGYTRAEKRFLSSLGALKAYSSQKTSAKKRQIGWKLTPMEWWGIWDRSGRWKERGRGVGGYVMCRYGDEGDYSLKNCFIAPSVENNRDGGLKSVRIRRAKNARSRRS